MAPASNIPPQSQASDSESLASLILRAYAVVRPTILAARKMEGLTLMEARLMRKIQSYPGRKLADLAADLLLGVTASEDLVKGLLARQLIAVSADGILSLTPAGSDRFSAVLAHARELEGVELAGIPAEDIKAAKRVLSELISRHARNEPPD